MHTESDDELRTQTARSQEIGRQIAELLNEAARIAPNAVAAQVTGLGFSIRGAGGGFVARTR
ncbi:hypothetical protein ABT119_06115 [Streptomyces sp. NPDC001910]|uniref:hypothetical protein n=1 Tax=Streptomyces sp. NPDC001910 TaxID=3154403 RepID=UPI00331B416D